ncbi:MAG: ATP-dependent ligase [Gemmatimonadetes bacterium]|jgi:ATP-dependent DNA ligase|nr:ATP-dependent ligase [Gemmatimonadota bacterium]
MATLPSRLSPMLASPTGTLPPDLAGRAIEPKWDGSRLIANPPRAAGVAWVRPVLVAQVRYNELTDAGVLRQPSFLGLRNDRDARDVTLEVTGGALDAIESGMRCAW